MERVTVVSSDAHVSPPYSVYREYIDPSYRDRLDDLEAEEKVIRAGGSVNRGSILRPGPEVIDDRGLLAAEEYRNDADLKRRLELLDGEGIAGETVLAGTSNHAMPFFYEMNTPYPPDVRAAGTRAYHRWLTDFVGESQGRLYGHAYPIPSPDVQDLVDELRYVSDRGFVSMEVPGFVPDPDLPALSNKEYDPFWAECAERGIVLIVHAGWGHRQGMITDAFAYLISVIEEAGGNFDPMTMLTPKDDKLREVFASLLEPPSRVLWHLLFGGVFDRHPNLKLSFTEVGAAWIPETLRYLDEKLAAQGVKLQHTAQEYFARHCAVTATAIRLCEIEMRDEIGIDRIMFGADFPHPESTFPNTRQWLAHAFRGVEEDDMRKILGENAIRIFNLDRGPLDEAAARIGPTLSELAAGVELDERVLTSFDYRNKYRVPAQPVDRGLIDEYLAADLAEV